MGKDRITWIDQSLGDIDKLERAKIGIEFLVKNYQRQEFSEGEKESLARYFRQRLTGGSE